MTSVQRAKAFHDAAFYALPVVGAVALFVTAIFQGNTALFAVAAGMLGVPGIKSATTLVNGNGGSR